MSATAAPRWRRWSAMPVRTRVVMLLIFLTAVALVLSGGTAYVLQRTAINNRIDDSLTRSVDEFRILAEEGINPETGTPFSEADQLVFVAMQRTLPARSEGMLGFQGDQVAWTANSGVVLRLEDDPELIEWAQGHADGDSVRIETVTTAQTTYRAVVVPIQFNAEETPSMLLLAYDHSAEMRELNYTFLTYGGVALGGVAVVSLVGWFLVGRLLAPLRALQSTAAEITATDLRRRVPLSGQDDVGQLAATFNEMLDRLQHAFSSQRQLLDDVGHELRTPITIVQGNLELQDVDDPADVAQVREVSLDELDRMRRLVDDLVTLAKAGRPDFVEPAPVDVQQLTRDVLEKATRLGERVWTMDHAANATWSLDTQRITQAWLQLASNAVKYSTNGSKVSLGSQALNGRLRLWVRDQGVGIRPEDQQRIFDRFGRGSNSTRAEGAGLGLNIVTAIVEAHGGIVNVQSAPGAGSTFYIDLDPAGRPPAPRAGADFTADVVARAIERTDLTASGPRPERQDLSRTGAPTDDRAHGTGEDDAARVPAARPETRQEGEQR